MDKTKKQIKFAWSVLVLATFTAGAFAIAPAPTPTATVAPVDLVVVTGEVKLKGKAKFCVENCAALLEIDGYEVFVEYGLDGNSIDYLEPISVSKNGVEVNAHIDQADIQNINAAIIKGDQ